MTSIAQHAAAAHKFSASHNEGGAGYNPHWVAHDQACADAAEARMVDLVARAAEIRAAWNAAVVKYSTATGLPMSAIKLVEQAAGVTMVELQSLKARLAK